MDILKIRKKKAAQVKDTRAPAAADDADAPAASHDRSSGTSKTSAAPPPPVTTTTATSPPPEPPPPLRSGQTGQTSSAPPPTTGTSTPSSLDVVESAGRARAPERPATPVAAGVVEATSTNSRGRRTKAERAEDEEQNLRAFLAAYDDDGDAPDTYNTGTNSQIDLSERYLAIGLVGERYAASIMDIREILTIRSLTEVPRAPREVLGVVSKRGMVLPVIDLATALGLRAPDRRLQAQQRVLVVGDGDRVCGLRVDEVTEVIKLSQSDIEPVPPSIGARNAGLLLGLGRLQTTMFILLDLPAVLDAFAVSVGLPPTRAELRA